MKDIKIESIESGEVTWEIFSLDSLEEQCLVERGYVGGIRIGHRMIFLLKFRFFEMKKLKRVATPRFMMFDKGTDYTKREYGTPMSRDEFDDLVEFLFTKKDGKAITDCIYDQVEKSYL